MLFARKISLILLLLGILIIISSTFLVLPILAFIGLTFILYGLLFLFLVPNKYMKLEVMEQIVNSFMLSNNQLIKSLNLEGKPIYVPFQKPSYLLYDIGLNKEFVYVPEKDDSIVAIIEQAFLRKPNGIRLIPPGQGLADLIENKTKMDLNNSTMISLCDILPSIIITDLEIADKFEISISENVIKSKIYKSVLESTQSKICQLSPERPYIGCPFCSSIACLLTRVMKKPILIENCSLNNSVIETTFRILLK